MPKTATAERTVPTPVTNAVRTRADWNAMRAAVLADPGAFHGEIASRNLHWLVTLDDGRKAWLTREGETWTGWDAATLAPVNASLGADFAPWDRAFNADDAPHFRWFEGGRTNAAFNELDRHVLKGFGTETAVIFEGDRWDMAEDGGRGAPVDCYPISRRRLLLEAAKCALALKALGLKAGDRIALNMPNIPAQIFWTEGAKRAGIIYTPVFGGFSDKTLSDRIHDAGAKVVVTADGGFRNAQIFAFKTAYTDPALDNYVPVGVAIELLETRLKEADLELSADDAAVIGEAVKTTLKGEVTVERGDVMRGVGRALAELGNEGRVDAAAAARVRIAVAEALVATPPRVEAVVVARHTGQPDIVWRERDVWSHDLTDKALADILAAAGLADLAALEALDDAGFVQAIWKAAPPLPVDAEYPMFFIYTSGSTGKPKGVVHVHGGYAAGIAETMKVAFDARPGDTIYVVADPGWITGQSYMIAAPLLTRVTTVVGEGSPVFPHAGRFAAMIERHGVTIFKAGVTFLKAIMTDPQNLKDFEAYDLSGLRVATFCAEPTSPSVQAFGMANVTPNYINSYWATEHGGIAWTHFYGNGDFPLAADARTFPLPWIVGDVWLEDAAGTADAEAPFARTSGGVKWRRAATGEKGEIVIASPYPYLARTVWGDSGNFRVEDGAVVGGWKGDAGRWSDGYWGRWDGVWAYTQGDFAVRHTDEGFSLHGRSDDVINVSGHRMGTEEIEGAILRDKALDPNSPLGNVLVVGAPHREKGLTPIAFVTAAPGRVLTRDDFRRLSDLVRQEKGSVAVPGDFIEVSQFPETRSGKYVRRMVRAVVEGAELGDVSTLRNPESLDELKSAVAAWENKQKLSSEQAIFDRYRYFRVQYNDVGAGQKVATVYVTNPPVNALNERAIDELVIVVEHLSRRDDVVAVVFTGDGTASFVAGADIRQFLDEIHTVEEARVLPNNAQLAFGKIEAMNKPCVAAIQGVALGGGMEFALACHWRVAEKHARFGQPEIRLRLLPGYGGTQRLPRLLADKRGPEGLRDSLDLILGGRSIDGEEALGIGLVETLADGAHDALALAHAEVREFVRHGESSRLGRTWAERRKAAKDSWQHPGIADLDEALSDDFVQRILRQLDWAGRGTAGARAIEAIRTGWTGGMAAGLVREGQLFAEAVVDPQGGKTGIREFLDKKSPPLPVRRNGVYIDSEHDERGATLQTAGELLPMGAAFFPGVTAIPSHQYAFGIARDADTGAPRFGEPATHERELIVPVPTPEANEALVYLLTSEVNFNDIWALTGIPVSPFDGHEEDVQVTGSGGLALVASLGSEARAQGRLKVGDLVAVYSGTSDLLSPIAGRDPMYADFAIQGYESKTGSHAQFLTVQAPQLHAIPGDLTLEQAGSYILNLGTIVRCLFTTLDIVGGKTIFIEGSATGTGLDALKTAKASGLAVTGMVSSPARAEFVRAKGAVGSIDRTEARFKALFTSVPDGGKDDWTAWEAAGEPMLAEYRAMNGGKLADYAVSHAGETAFPRTFQMLGEGGVLAFYGASSGYHLSFMGKPGAVSPEAMLAKAGARGGEAVLIFYGPGSRALADPMGLEMIEAARGIGARTVVVTTTDGQREFILSLGFEDAVAGVVSLEAIKRREGANFDWPDTMPRLPVAREDIETFREAVRDFQDKTLKPFGGAVGKLLRSPDNPRGNPDIIMERAGQDTLGVTTALVKPFTGRVIYCEDMTGQRYNFYAPQVWTRQRRIIMPSTEIRGTHLCNAYEVTRMNDLVASGQLDVTEPTVVPWEGLPEAHQSMWDNRHSGATYIVNHALPVAGLRSKDELFEAWAALGVATQAGEN
ncbi:acrylyl-CoA reductase (NADPH)/3-hydroxypropionyl-CoA dehydratase/3-hydroxypropionyl-CoA synthetase [Polymorphobacter multimanifer]|uniref:acetate--CoA ligase n=1 Tax=Polymorphobacter multimanifer TaxID=1070431 RepID=A0A841L4I6_9SPHN|nr:AMP-binding protein [Polymorphobacter multimanifer]MBB6225873.1 acrylyl-CoA reductase (NADPH)/3-hydroxypropionyl-CoA dehydratase/3-hydroxypropionyl-CoA synthetase [Polymorphobacter multimanifer]